MEQIKDRIRKIRADTKLTQEKFAEKLGLKRNTIATYEIGKSVPIDAVVLSICREFNINEQWLRTGEGEMFEKQNNAAVAKAAQLLGKKDPIFEAFIETYADLSPSDRDILLKTSMKFLKSLEKYNGNTD